MSDAILPLFGVRTCQYVPCTFDFIMRQYIALYIFTKTAFVCIFCCNELVFAGLQYLFLAGINEYSNDAIMFRTYANVN